MKTLFVIIFLLLLVAAPSLAENTHFLSTDLVNIYSISYEFEITGHKAKDIAITGLFYHEESSYTRPDIDPGDPNIYPEDFNWVWDNLEVTIAFNKYSNGQVSYGYFWGPRLGLRYTMAKLNEIASGMGSHRKAQLYTIPKIGLGYKWNLPAHIGIAIALDAGAVYGAEIRLGSGNQPLPNSSDMHLLLNLGIKLGYNW